MNAFDALTLACAIGCGLMAGIFFAFSNSVMAALGEIPAASGIAAMQAINVVILNPLFLSVFLGTALACILAVVVCFLQSDTSGAAWVLGGAALYLGGTVLVTMRFNVPRNNTLAKHDPATPEASRYWQDYLRSWTAWNHVRTIASLAAAVSFMLRALLN